MNFQIFKKNGMFVFYISHDEKKNISMCCYLLIHTQFIKRERYCTASQSFRLLYLIIQESILFYFKSKYDEKIYLNYLTNTEQMENFIFNNIASHFIECWSIRLFSSWIYIKRQLLTPIVIMMKRATFQFCCPIL